MSVKNESNGNSHQGGRSVPMYDVWALGRDGGIQPEASDLCGVCGCIIRTVCFKNTGACSVNHFKQRYGNIKLSKIQPI
jgi:hypothetical protein